VIYKEWMLGIGTSGEREKKLAAASIPGSFPQAGGRSGPYTDCFPVLISITSNYTGRAEVHGVELREPRLSLVASSPAVARI